MAKKRKKGKEVSRLSLRIPPEVHSRLATVARTLGLNVNGVSNLILFRGVGQLELETKAYQRMGGADTDQQFDLMEEWLRQNPGQTRKMYVLNFIRELMDEPGDPFQVWQPPDVSGPPTVTIAVPQDVQNKKVTESNSDGDDF